jgi:hypothetical protein
VCKTMWGEVGSNEGMKIVKGGWNTSYVFMKIK